MALAAASDVSNLLGGYSFSTSESSIVTALITSAEGHIEREAERYATLEDADRTETFDAPDSPAIWLRHTPVNSVASVTVDGTALTSSQYDWTVEGRITRVANGRPRSWSTAKLSTIVVAYNGGYETVPADLTDIAARAAARAFQAGAAYASVPVSASGIRQVALQGSDSVTFEKSTSDVTTAVFLTEEEKAVARMYRNAVIA